MPMHKEVGRLRYNTQARLVLGAYFPVKLHCIYID